VLYAIEHPLDDDRIAVFHALVNLFQTQSIEVLALLCRGTDAALDLSDLQCCHDLRFQN